ncbi:MAG: thiolase family protein [Streptosporangiales bacterium]|nr:thiolase family protein [Streptosporangiales bacterium]
MGAAILGVGMTQFGRHDGRSFGDLGIEAVLAALESASVQWEQVDAVVCGNVVGGMLPGQRVLREIGASDLPVINVENACASAGTALHLAISMVERGEQGMVLALGIEQLSVLGGGLLPQDADDIEVLQGATLPSSYAMRARRYMHDHGMTAEQLALQPLKAHRNGSLNKHVQVHRSWTVEDVVQARMIADPLTLFMCCPNGDGAAAAVVCSTELARRLTSRPVEVAASVVVSGRFSPVRDFKAPETTVTAAAQAYESAGIGPDDLDLVECHDPFAVAEILYYEILGLAPPGGGVELLVSGATRLEGKIPVNPSGGLMARGHPIGATGLAQVAEAFWQLRGEAGARQLAEPRAALTHVTGGGISGYDNGACAIHVLKR